MKVNQELYDSTANNFFGLGAFPSLDQALGSDTFLELNNKNMYGNVSNSCMMVDFFLLRVCSHERAI